MTDEEISGAWKIAEWLLKNLDEAPEPLTDEEVRKIKILAEILKRMN